MTKTCLNDSTAGAGYLPVCAGIILLATNMINPQTTSEKDMDAFQGKRVPFSARPWDSYLNNACGTGGIVAGKYFQNPVEILESFISAMVNSSIDSPREFDEVFRKNFLDLLA